MICSIQISEILRYVMLFIFTYFFFVYVNMFIVSHGFNIDLHEMLYSENNMNEDYVEFVSLIVSMSFISTLVLVIIILYEKIKKIKHS